MQFRIYFIDSNVVWYKENNIFHFPSKQLLHFKNQFYDTCKYLQVQVDTLTSTKDVHLV